MYIYAISTLFLFLIFFALVYMVVKKVSLLDKKDKLAETLTYIKNVSTSIDPSLEQYIKVSQLNVEDITHSNVEINRFIVHYINMTLVSFLMLTIWYWYGERFNVDDSVYILLSVALSLTISYMIISINLIYINVKWILKATKIVDAQQRIMLNVEFVKKQGEEDT